MPTLRDLDVLLEVARTPQELDYLFEQLTSPEWIPLLRQRGLFDDPPSPIRDGDRIGFPGWSRSRYLARVASEDPDLVMSVLLEVEGTDNPRIWVDILQAVAQMPAAYAVPVLERLDGWVHTPFQLGAEDQVAAIGMRLAEAGMTADAMFVLSTLAALAPPGEVEGPKNWQPLDAWDYARLVPPLAAALARLTGESVALLANCLEAAAESGVEDGASYSAIWRPAIEAHPQNWGHRERLETLLEAIRDASLLRVDEDPGSFSEVVRWLLSRSLGVLNRVGLYLLAERGGLDLHLVGQVLTRKTVFRDTEFHHEFYRLANRWFRELPRAVQRRYVELCDETGQELAADRGGDASVAEWWALIHLHAVAEGLEGAARNRYADLVTRRGVPDHPDFLSWHESWFGPTSPKSGAELEAMDLDELVAFLGTWSAPDTFGPAPSREGLARELQGAVAAHPAKFAPLAPRLTELPPVYAGWYLVGLREALAGDETFGTQEAVALCAEIAGHRAQPESLGAEADGWLSGRLDAARFLEELITRDRLEDAQGREAWNAIAALLEDPDPTSELAGLDPLSQSMNTTRGEAVHAALAYAWWSRRHSPDPPAWRLWDMPALAVALERHISAASDPSPAIAAAFGWWLEMLIGLDSAWAEAHSGRLLGELVSPREHAAWSAFLMRSGPSPATYRVLQSAYSAYARVLIDAAQGVEARDPTGPVRRYLSHLIVLDLHRVLPPDSGPLSDILALGSPALLEAVAAEGGRLAHDMASPTEELAAGFHSLWQRIRSRAEGGGESRAALAQFSWWFASNLPASWTLPGLLALLNEGVRVVPEFLLIPKLAALVDEHRDEVMLALELLVPLTDERWAFRTHHDEVQRILRSLLASGDASLQARARQVIDRLGRLGMLDLGTLLDQ